MSRLTTRRWLAIGIALIAALPITQSVRREVDGWSLVFRAAHQQGVLRRFADLDTVSVHERLVGIPSSRGPIPARVYAPARHARQTVLLVSGLHPAGIDEPRLVDLAQKLAEANVVVVTPEIPGLSRFEITSRLTDRIEETAVWLATQSGLAPNGRIGLMGVSFSGGLALVAAGRPSLRDHLLYVFSFGGHDDLPTVMEYFCTGGAPGAVAPPPHDYGLAVVLLNVAAQLVPPGQLQSLTDAVRRFLWASYLDTVDNSDADHEFAALRTLASTLPQPAATLLGYVNDRDVAHLGPVLAPYVGPYAGGPALSPARSPLTSAPVFLLHGTGDNVIPASESRHLAERLRGHAPVRLLVTDLISHADADQPAHAVDVLKLAHFWSDLLAR
jgi:dienelactone hydrolase